MIAFCDANRPSGGAGLWHSTPALERRPKAKKNPAEAGFSKFLRDACQSLLAADRRDMKLSSVFSTTRNHSTSSARNGFHDS